MNHEVVSVTVLVQVPTPKCIVEVKTKYLFSFVLLIERRSLCLSLSQNLHRSHCDLKLKNLMALSKLASRLAAFFSMFL